MYIYEIKITQSDCPHIDVTNEFRDVYILVMNTMEEMETQKMFSVVYSRSQEDLTSALKLLDSHRLVNELELISRRPNVAAIFYEMQETSMYRRTAREGFRIHPMVAHRGMERWFVVCKRDRSANEIYRADETTRILSARQLSSEEFLHVYPSVFYDLQLLQLFGDLTESDFRLLKVAFNTGYFEWPRKVDLAELSRIMSLPKSTLSYKLRQIDRKIAKVVDERLSG